MNTPASHWRENGEPDPHGTRYDCDRSALALGNLTDDELANAVYMHGAAPLNVDGVMRGEPQGHDYLMAAKDRIRWLSRKLSAAAIRNIDKPRGECPGDHERLPAAEALARRFHEVYERLAPLFGYETRKETRAFDPTTPNGRLMIAVCAELAPVPFQERVRPWTIECFGEEIANDRVERNHRFLEESLELVQSLGCTASEAHQLVDYVFGRPVGEPGQELGGVMVTAAALANANGLLMDEAGVVELARCCLLIEKIRAKQAAKPKHSPLPEQPAVRVAISMGSAITRVVDKLHRLTQGRVDDETFTADVRFIRSLMSELTAGATQHRPRPAGWSE